jgi:hypothetical protein
VPSTHTHPTANQHRKVTTGPGNNGPLPFGAPFPIKAAPAVISMTAIVLTATTSALLRLYPHHPYRFHIVVGVLALLAAECLAMTVWATVRNRGPEVTEGSHLAQHRRGRRHEPRHARMLTVAGHSRGPGQVALERNER